MLLLREADVRITGGNLDALSLSTPDRKVREGKVHLATTPTPPTPSKFQAILKGRLRTLIVTSRPTGRLTEAALEDEVDLITVDPLSVIFGGVPRLEPRPSPGSGEKSLQRGAVGTAARTHPRQGHTDIAGTRSCGRYQPAGEQTLEVLESFVDRYQWRWKAHDVDAIMSMVLANYPGPRGVTSYWYGLDPVMEQAKKAADFAQELGASRLVSGDAAADLFAPWRLSDQTIVYLREAVDLTDAGFAPATPEEATTLITTVPEDFTLWATAALAPHPGPIRLADPLITILDVMSGDVVDSHEAAREAILAKATP